MAKKAKYDWGKTRSSKYQKFETRITSRFDVEIDSHDSVYVDTAQCLSLINRKLVRQGHVFQINGLRFWSDDAASDSRSITVSALPRTWMMFNAYKKARSLWNQMNLEAIDSLGTGNLPKYYDFKVLFDKEHFENHILQEGSNSSDDVALHDNLLPVDGDGNAMTAGEWVYSKWETSAGSPVEFHGHMCGTHVTNDGSEEGSSGRDLPADGGSAGLILAYQQSRGATFTDQDLAGMDQNVDIDSPWAQLFSADAQRQAVLTDLDVDNDGPPYPADYAGGIEAPEGHFVGAAFLEGGDRMGVTSPQFRSFEAPLGLVKLDINREAGGTDVDNVWMTFDAKIIGSC